MNGELWTPAVEVIPPARKGSVRVEHFEVSAEESAFSFIRRGGGVDPGKYARLYVCGQLMMSDTDMEKRSNRRAVLESEGDVLIAGLGIGLIILPMLKRAEVQSITVIEQSQDVIDIVLPSILSHDPENAHKLTVIQSDIFDWTPAKGVKWDCIYFDIWPNICTDNLEQMSSLHQKFKSRLKGKRWMDSWMKDALKDRKRREDKESRRSRRMVSWAGYR